MIPPDALEEIKRICHGAQEMSEAGVAYLHLPQLKLPDGRTSTIVEALLCMQSRDGYPTRLFLSQPFSGKGQNWTTHRILDKVWHTCSWNHISSDLRPAQILAEHLRAFR